MTVAFISNIQEAVVFSHQLEVLVNDFFMAVPLKAFHRSPFNFSKKLQKEYRLVQIILVSLVTYV